MSGTGTVLITGARAPVAMEWAAQFRSAGWNVLAADSMPLPLAGWSRSVFRTWRTASPRQSPTQYLQEIAGICRSQQVSWIIPTCEEIFTLAGGRDLLPPSARLWCADIGLLAVLHNKGTFPPLAASFGLPVPEFRIIIDPAEALALSGDWYLKPCFSRFGTEGRLWTDIGLGSAGKQQWLARQAMGPARSWIAQERLQAPAFCSFALAEEGRILRQVVYPVEFTAGGACISFRSVRHDPICEWVRHFVQSLRFTGQIAFDFMTHADGRVLPLECNPRATSGLHLIRDAAAVFTGPGMESPVCRGAVPVSEQKAGNSGMLSIPMLLYGAAQAVRQGTAVEWLQQWRASRDVVWRAGDPGPAVAGNAWMLFWLLREARRLQVSPLQASTWDLEWNGP